MRHMNGCGVNGSFDGWAVEFVVVIMTGGRKRGEG